MHFVKLSTMKIVETLYESNFNQNHNFTGSFRFRILIWTIHIFGIC